MNDLLCLVKLEIENAVMIIHFNSFILPKIKYGIDTLSLKIDIILTLKNTLLKACRKLPTICEDY